MSYSYCRSYSYSHQLVLEFKPKLGLEPLPFMVLEIYVQLALQL